MKEILIFFAGATLGLSLCLLMICMLRRKRRNEEHYQVSLLEESKRKLAEAKKQITESRLWLTRTLKSIGDAVIVTDNHGNTLMLNPVAERLLGIRQKAVMGRPHEDFFHIVNVLDGEPCHSPVGRALQTKETVETLHHVDLVSKTGVRYHITDSAAPILDEQGNVLGTVLVFRDVTEEYQRRAALRDVVNEWEIASNISGIASFRIDYRTRKITGSYRLPEFWPVVDGKALPPEEWVLPDDLEDGHKLMDAVAEGKEKHTFYRYRARKDGKIRYYRIYGAVDEERPGEIVGVIQDMTTAYEQEQQLQNTQEMWNNLIDVLPLIFFAKNADNSLCYTHCNQRFSEFIGRKPDEIIGRTDAELFGDNPDSKRFVADDRKILLSGKVHSFTETIVDLHKRPFFFHSVKMPCIGPDGERLLLGVSMDITELVTLNKSQEIIRQGLETLVAENDVNEGIAKAMKTVCEYIGVSRSYILHFDVKKKNVTCVHEYLRNGELSLAGELHDISNSMKLDWEKNFQNEFILNISDPQNEDTLKAMDPFCAELIKKNEIRSLYFRRLDLDGIFWGYVGFVYEKETRVLNKSELDFMQYAVRFIELMIHHRRTQQELHDAVIKATAAEKAKSIFLATMSHEIRTPLSAVIGFSELLRDETLPVAQQKDYLNDISIAGSALLLLINDILDLSKLDAGKMQFTKTVTDFGCLAMEIMTVFRQKFKEKHLEERVTVQDLPLIKIDPLRIRQILFNLIGNAVKFTDNGYISIHAEFFRNEKGHTGTFRFSVRDTGCGISKEDGKRLFQPFVQLTSMVSTRKSGSGTGLGLVLVRRMLEFMNGEITLESKFGEGSTFNVTLRDVEYVETTETLPPTPSEINEKQAHLSISILLVDDAPMNLKFMRAILQKHGANVVAVESGPEALAALESNSFDMVLTDLWMPGMSGIELAGRIRQTGKCPHTAIVAVTADTEAQNNFDSHVFDAVFTKPITMEKLYHFYQKKKKTETEGNSGK